MTSNLQYLAKKVGDTIYAGDSEIIIYDVYSILNNSANILVGSLESVSQSINIQYNKVIINSTFNMNINDADNLYNFTWTSSNNINKELVVYSSSPANLVTTNQDSVFNYAFYTISIANIFDDLFLYISW
jgi:hypothetical protein